MPDFSFIQLVFIWAIPVLFGIVLHEISHGWVANYFGDPTAKAAGRLSLNPIKHIDPIGTVVLPVILLYISNFIIGWAKPVPVTWENLGHPRRDMALVAFAGPAANLLMLVFWVIVAKLLLMTSGNAGWITIMLAMCSAGVLINILLMILNLFPLLPLDGGRIVFALLPARLARPYSRLEPYGIIILVIFLVTGLLGNILGPVIQVIHRFTYQIIQ